ncbi:casein kinase 1-like protein HD16 [Tanacetum coccineum]
MYGLSYVDLPEAVPEDEHTHQNENGGGQSQALVMLSDPVSNPKAAEAPKFYETTNQGSSIVGANNGSSIVVMSKGTQYSQQSYKVSDSFPFKKIKKKWRKDFHVTSMATAGTRWGIFMSCNTGLASVISSKPLSAVHDEERMHDGLVVPPMPTAPTPPVLEVTVSRPLDPICRIASQPLAPEPPYAPPPPPPLPTLHGIVSPPPLQDVVPSLQPPPPPPMYEAPAPSKISAPPVQVITPPPARSPPAPSHPPSVYVEPAPPPPPHPFILVLIFFCSLSNSIGTIVGAPCGVMDRMASACGEANKLLAVVCQSAEAFKALLTSVSSE